jgi:PDZ domain-containing protein
VRLRYILPTLFVVIVVAAAALWTIPADDFLFTPDPAKSLEGRLEVEGAKPAPGEVLYVDVFVRRATLLEELLPFTRPDGSTLIPESALLPPGTSDADRDRENARAMEQSEVTASAVALRALGYDVEATPRGARVDAVRPGSPADGKLRSGDLIVAVDGRRVRTLASLSSEIGRREPGESVRLTVRRDGQTLTPVVGTVAAPGEGEQGGRPVVGILVTQDAAITLPIRIDIDLGQVGGPSAGLPFALEIARMLGRDVTKGCEIAATGEIALDGTVLPVGGLKQKTIGARQADVDAFVVPAGDNAQDARKAAGDLPVIPVDSFQQALQKLATAGLNC